MKPFCQKIEPLEFQNIQNLYSKHGYSEEIIFHQPSHYYYYFDIMDMIK